MLLSTLFTITLVYSGGGGSSGEGQSCDAVNICSSGTCPKGMDKVAVPERSAAYTIRTGDGSLATDSTSYTPGETVTIFIKVTEHTLQTRVQKGMYLCMCDWPYRDQHSRDCTEYTPTGNAIRKKRSSDGTVVSYPGPIPCKTKKMESANYIGLLLYAVNPGEQKIGTWELPAAEPNIFFTPPDPLCGGKAVMHADATPKRLLHKFVFRAPPAGYGTITFRALLKHGDTNGGSFFWPTAPASGATSGDSPADTVPGGDLTLTEAPLPTGAAGQSWFRATAAGQSCDDVCQALTPAQVCDLDALTSVGDDPASLLLATQRFYSLNTPALSDCRNAGPALSDTDERWLFFHKTTSTSNTCDASELQSASCGAVPTEDDFKLRRLCPCKASRRRLTFRPPHTLPSPKRSGAASIVECPHYTPLAERRRLGDANAATSRSVAPLATSLTLGVLASLGGGGRLATTFIPLVLFAAAQLPRAAAHNWMWSPSSRASQASTTKPCRPKRSHIPDVHVNPGQEFEVEWATGHGENPNSGAHYFTIVKAEHEPMLVLVGKNVIEDYINSALDAEHWAPKERWAKRHLSWNSTQSGSSGGVDNIVHEDEGKVLMHPNTDPHYIHRANAFKCGRMGRPRGAPSSGDNCREVPGGLSQWTYTSPKSISDASVAYSNSK